MEGVHGRRVHTESPQALAEAIAIEAGTGVREAYKVEQIIDRYLEVCHAAER